MQQVPFMSLNRRYISAAALQLRTTQPIRPEVRHCTKHHVVTVLHQTCCRGHVIEHAVVTLSREACRVTGE